MLPESRQQILHRLGEDDRLLDVGGWADPLERADCVIDVMPFATRGLYGREGWGPVREADAERFSEATWFQRDICDRTPWPFDDDEFDFVVCSHTLEDVRDPLWVCSEIVRVGRAGYVEAPSRLEEQSWGVAGPFVGWRHHHWLIDVGDDSIRFIFKPHSIHTLPAAFFPPGFVDDLTARERISQLWWEGDFNFSERIFVEERVDLYLTKLVERELRSRGGRSRGGPTGIRRRLAARLVGAR